MSTETQPPALLQFRLPGRESPRVCEAAAALYRPRRPEKTTFYSQLEKHFEDYTRVHSERFEHEHGTLRRVVRRVVEAFLNCGRHKSGFARLRCGDCKREHLIAFSCQTRNFCPSCQSKRAALFGEFLAERVLLSVPHRHIVFTIPKSLRRLFERDRRLLGILARSAHDATRGYFQKALGMKRALPGMVSSIQTFGSQANWHPHIHALVTDGLLERGGRFHALGRLDTKAIEQRFRKLVLARLRRAERLSESFEQTLLSWDPSGFSVHAGEAIEATQRESLERMARYMTRGPIAQARVFEQKEGRVKLLTPPDPRTGQGHLLFDPLEWVHAVTTQIPDDRQHLVRYQGAYANVVRALYRPEVGEAQQAEEESAPPADDGADISTWGKQRRRSWARLLRRIYEVDPLLCPCGGELRIVSVITDPVVVDRILAHRNGRRLKSPFSSRAPPGP